MQIKEIEKAKEELDKTKTNEIYKISGPILIKSKKSDVLQELKEKREFLDTRLKTIEKSEQKIREKLNEIIKSRENKEE